MLATSFPFGDTTYTTPSVTEVSKQYGYVIIRTVTETYRIMERIRVLKNKLGRESKMEGNDEVV